MSVRSGVDGAGRGAGVAAAFSRWERTWSRLERWLPYAMLAVSAVPTLAAPGRPATERAVLAVTSLVAAGWVAAGHTFAPERWRGRRWWGPAYVTGLLLLAWALMRWEPAYFVFAITGFLHAAILRPRWLVFAGTGATSFLILSMTWEGGFPQPTVEATLAFLTVLLLQTVLIGAGVVGGEVLGDLTEQRRRTVERLEATLAENEGLHAQLVVQAREAGVHDERRRMAREIHDTLAQGFTGIITQLEAAQQSRGDAAAVEGHITAAVDLARRSLTEARRSVHALRPGELARGRLVDALDELRGDWDGPPDLEVDASLADTVTLPPAVEVVLLRITQEALHNVRKHADASRVRVSLSVLDDRVLLDVRDDGRGFTPAAAMDDTMRYGLTSMRQRAEGVGGTLRVESAPGAGTAIGVELPLAEELTDA